MRKSPSLHYCALSESVNHRDELHPSTAQTPTVFRYFVRRAGFGLQLAALVGLTTLLGAQDVTTAHYDNIRSGVQANETVLTPSNVISTVFGKTFSLPVIGDVYAQPLYLHQYLMNDGNLHNVLIVATEQDYVYAFDADGKNPAQGYLWRQSLLGSGETWLTNNDVGTSDIAPYIGITGTPVIDRTGGTVYLVAKSKTTANAAIFIQRLHALDIATGLEKLNGPTAIQATANGTGDGGTTVAFSPLLNNQRPALLLAATPGAASPSSVFIGWSSHGDNGQYHGWIIAYNSADISKQTGAWVDTPNGKGGGIWMSGGGISTDGKGNIFAADGNGTFGPNANGGDYGDSAFKLNLSATGLTRTDSFTPSAQATLSGIDADMGTSAMTLLPAQSGSIPNLLVTTDKSGRIYLINRDLMGGYNTSTNSSLQDFTNTGYSIHSSFVFFNNTLFEGGDGGPIQAWTFNPMTERFTTSDQSQSSETYGCNGCDGGGATPSVSANGANNGIVWTLDNSVFGSGPAILRAYNPTNLATEYYNSAQAANNRDTAAVAVKFTTPTIANGQVYVGGRNAITVYGLLSTAPQPAATPTFSPAGGSYSITQTVTLASSTANSSIYYTTNGTTPSSASTLYSGPIQVAASETLQAVAVAPGSLQSAVGLATYTITAVANQGTASFASGFTSGSLLLNGSAKLNGSRLRLTDGGATEAGSAYFPNKVNIQSFTNDFSFQVTNPGADGFTFLIQNAGGTALGYTGGGLGYGADSNNGVLGIKSSVAVKFDLYNNLGEGADSTGLYTNGASPTLPSTDLTSTNINLHSGDLFSAHMVYDGTTLSVTITDQSTKVSATQKYTVNIPSIVGGPTAYVGFSGGTGGLTATQDIASWVFASTPYFPSFTTTTTGLKLNGAATLATAQLRLTSGGFNQYASVFFPTTVNVSNFTSSFNFQLTNPGADGFTFVIQNAGLTAMGSSGGGLGYGTDGANAGPNIPSSLAIKFDLYSNANEGPDSTGLYVGGASPTVPSTDLTSSGVNLHSGNIFSANLSYNGTALTVTITDTVTKKSATQSYTVNIPSTVGGTYAYVGFTAGTGGLTATQDILSWTYISSPSLAAAATKVKVRR